MRIITLVLFLFLFVTICLAGDKFLVKIKNDKKFSFNINEKGISTNNVKIENFNKIKTLKNIKKLKLKYLFPDSEVYELRVNDYSSYKKLMVLK